MQMSIGPCAVAASQTMAGPSTRPRSAVIDDTVTPWARHSAATCSSAWVRRAVTIRCTPSAASSFAIAAPIPLDAPVTRARFPVSSDIRANYHPSDFGLRATGCGQIQIVAASALAPPVARCYDPRMRYVGWFARALVILGALLVGCG